MMIKRVQKVINPSSCINFCTIYTLSWAFTTPKTTQKRGWTQYHVLILSRCKNHFQSYIVATIPQGEPGRSDLLLERHRNATACPGGFKTTKVTKRLVGKNTSLKTAYLEAQNQGRRAAMRKQTTLCTMCKKNCKQTIGQVVSCQKYEPRKEGKRGQEQRRGLCL